MTDYIVLGSDSGRLVIVSYNGKRNCFERVHCETFGKTGVSARGQQTEAVGGGLVGSAFEQSVQCLVLSFFLSQAFAESSLESLSRWIPEGVQ